ncbi:MAG: glycine--tRNA ligase subunit beta [Candidatus Dasytiphilus stammeri]
MKKIKNFLVEIGTEELPFHTLPYIAEEFAVHLIQELDSANLAYEEVKWYATPRRLAIKVTNLITTQPSSYTQIKAPPLFKLFNLDEKPTIIAQHWARQYGIPLKNLKNSLQTKSKKVFFKKKITGKKTINLLPNIVKNALLNISKQPLMRWGNNNIKFIRPIHTITLLFGKIIIEDLILGIKTNTKIYGHRFIGKWEINIPSADDYLDLLKKRGKVIANYQERKELIRNKIESYAIMIGDKVEINERILDEVTSQVEWPVILIANFEKKFLAIPILKHLLQEKHKYFIVYDKNHRLLTKVIFVANIESHNTHQIIIGNEKIIHSRLSDAWFFFQLDRKKRLIEYLPLLKTVMFHQKLGTMFDKTIRIQKLVTWIAIKTNENRFYCKRAALLAKCDLMTNMVFEFPETQGKIGMYYALLDGEINYVYNALKEHYQPTYKNDELPSNAIGIILAIADKIDTLSGIISVGLFPTGDQDPFALRRMALGIIRLIIENNIKLDLRFITEKSLFLHNKSFKNMNIVDEIINFIFARLRFWYHEKGYSIQNIQAVLSTKCTDLIDCNARIQALEKFNLIPAYKTLIIIYKRISNILDKFPVILYDNVQFALLEHPEEIKLAVISTNLITKLKYYFINLRYEEIIYELVQLNESLNTFFKKVIINTPEYNIKVNRLTLLSQLKTLFLRVANFSKIH